MNESRTRPHRLSARSMRIVAAVTLVTLAGVVATAGRADAASCLSATCNAKWPHDEGCAGGTVLEEIYSSGGNLGLSLRKNTSCGTARWARLVWDGPGYPAPPVRYNFKVERQQWVVSPASGGYWTLTHIQTRTTDGSLGAFVTRMVAGTNNGDARHRVCSRWSSVTDSWSDWSCTRWRNGAT
jgi:hypothetical protein